MNLRAMEPTNKKNYRKMICISASTCEEKGCVRNKPHRPKGHCTFDRECTMSNVVVKCVPIEEK